MKIDIEKVEIKKTIGELTCYDLICTDCPFLCINCVGQGVITLNEIKDKTLKKFPQLEPMREWIEKELNKEVEDD